MNSGVKLLSFVAILGALVGCVANPGPSSKQADTPPQLVKGDKENHWDNAAAFGPVPTELAALGQEVCTKIDKDGKRYKPTGYHSKARSFDGKQFEKGAFYCEEK